MNNDKGKPEEVWLAEEHYDEWFGMILEALVDGYTDGLPSYLCEDDCALSREQFKNGFEHWMLAGWPVPMIIRLSFREEPDGSIQIEAWLPAFDSLLCSMNVPATEWLRPAAVAAAN